MKKLGFTLIELLISSAIAAVLTGLLFFAFNQSSKLLPVLDSYDDVYTKATLLNTQLERDLSGAFAPIEFYVRQKKEKEAAAQKQEAEKKEQDEQQKKKAAQQAVETEKPKKEVKPLEKLFHGVSKDGMLDYLTFITNNPLAMYWSAKSGSARPRVVRVVYRLEEDKNAAVKSKKSYKLIRQESQNLEFSAFAPGKEGIREYVIADGIKEMKVSYRAFIEQKQEEKKEAPRKKEVRTFAEWVRKTEEEKESKEIVPLIPQITDVAIVFWDYQKKRIFPFEFVVYNRAEIPLTMQEQKTGSKLVKMISESASQLFAPKPQPPQPQVQNRFININQQQFQPRQFHAMGPIGPQWHGMRRP